MYVASFTYSCIWSRLIFVLPYYCLCQFKHFVSLPSFWQIFTTTLRVVKWKWHSRDKDFKIPCNNTLGQFLVLGQRFCLLMCASFFQALVLVVFTSKSVIQKHTPFCNPVAFIHQTSHHFSMVSSHITCCNLWLKISSPRCRKSVNYWFHMITNLNILGDFQITNIWQEWNPHFFGAFFIELIYLPPVLQFLQKKVQCCFYFNKFC